MKVRSVNIQRYSIPVLAAAILALTGYLSLNVPVNATPPNLTGSVWSYPPGATAVPETTTTSAVLLLTPVPKSTGSVQNFNFKNTAASPVAVMYVDSAATPASSPTTVAPIWSGIVPGASGGMPGSIYGSFTTRPLLFSKGLVGLCSSTAPPVWTAVTACTFWLNVDKF